MCPSEIELTTGETYNPTLRNVAGPWDRTYGYCMTQYLACIGPTIAAVIQDDTKGELKRDEADFSTYTRNPGRLPPLFGSRWCTNDHDHIVLC